MHVTLRTPVAQPPARVMAGFTRELFLALAPPFPKLKLHRFDGCQRGDQVEIELITGPLHQRWTSLITEHGQLPDGTHYFIDEAQTAPAPLRYWRHRHLIEPGPHGGSVIVDDIEFRTASPVLDALLYPAMWAQFAYRKPIYRRFFGRSTRG
jgi:ligand-binding SRPBCC domain-containing protein